MGLVTLTDEVLELLGSGVAIHVATRDDALHPEETTAMGVHVHASRQTVTLYLPEATSGPTLANARANGRIAATFARPHDHKAVQLKGRFLAARPSDACDRERQELYRGALLEQFAGIGIPRALTRRLTYWPSVAVDVQVEAVFVQTPGPSAGHPLTPC